MTVIASELALWTLTAAKNEIRDLSDTTHDDNVQIAINSISAAFERATSRELLLRDYSSGQYLNGTGRTDLLLPANPVRSLVSIAIDDGHTVPTSGWQAQGDDVRVDTDERSLILQRDIWPKGTRNVLVSYTGGYRVIPDTGTANQSQWLPDDLHKAGLREIARVFYDLDRARDGIQSRSFEGESITYFRPGEWLPSTYEVLWRYALDAQEVS